MSAELVRQLALLCTVAGLISGLIVAVTVRRPILALQVALDFWLAAGLLRLTGEPSWRTIAAAAAFLVLRRVVTAALRFTGRERS